MTAVDTNERAAHVHEETTETSRRPMLVVLVAIIALVVGGVVGWMLNRSDSGSTSDFPAMEELLADYTGAWVNNDEAAFRAVVTDDFLFNEYLYTEVGDNLSVAVFDNDVEQTASYVRRDTRTSPDWSVGHGDELTVVGDGPWFVSVQETWTSAVRVSDGTATYVVESEPDGSLRIVMHNWAGLERIER